MYRYAYDHFTCEYSHLSISLDKSLKGQDNCNTFVGKICRALAYLPFVYVVTIYRLFFIITTRLLLKIQSGWFYEDSLRSNSSEIVRGHLICGNIANKYELYRVSQQPRSQGLSPIRKTPRGNLVPRTRLKKAHHVIVLRKVKCSKSFINPNKRQNREYRAVV